MPKDTQNGEENGFLRKLYESYKGKMIIEVKPGDTGISLIDEAHKNSLQFSEGEVEKFITRLETKRHDSKTLYIIPRGTGINFEVPAYKLDNLIIYLRLAKEILTKKREYNKPTIFSF